MGSADELEGGVDPQWRRPPFSRPRRSFLFSGNRSAGAIFALCLWEMHYLYRSYVFSGLQRGSKPSFPVILAALALLFNINNGVIIGQDLFVKGKADLIDMLDLGRALGPRALLGDSPRCQL